jgi:hypothetical protein
MRCSNRGFFHPTILQASDKRTDSVSNSPRFSTKIFVRFVVSGVNHATTSDNSSAFCDTAEVNSLNCWTDYFVEFQFTCETPSCPWLRDEYLHFYAEKNLVTLFFKLATNSHWENNYCDLLCMYNGWSNMSGLTHYPSSAGSKLNVFRNRRSNITKDSMCL